MSDADLKLKAIFAADAPPARDPAFNLAVLHRIERRRLMLSTLVHAALAVALAGVLWAVWSAAADQVLDVSAEYAPAVALVVAALACLGLIEALQDAERRNLA